MWTGYFKSSLFPAIYTWCCTVNFAPQYKLFYNCYKCITFLYIYVTSNTLGPKITTHSHMSGVNSKGLCTSPPFKSNAYIFKVVFRGVFNYNQIHTIISDTFKIVRNI